MVVITLLLRLCKCRDETASPPDLKHWLYEDITGSNRKSFSPKRPPRKDKSDTFWPVKMSTFVPITGEEISPPKTLEMYKTEAMKKIDSRTFTRPKKNLVKVRPSIEAYNNGYFMMNDNLELSSYSSDCDKQQADNLAQGKNF